MTDNAMINRFRQARRDPSRTVMVEKLFCKICWVAHD